MRPPQQSRRSQHRFSRQQQGQVNYYDKKYGDAFTKQERKPLVARLEESADSEDDTHRHSSSPTGAAEDVIVPQGTRV